MSILIWDSRSQAVENLLEVLPQDLPLELVEKLDQFESIMQEYDHCDIFLDFDSAPSKVEKLVKLIRKKFPENKIFFLCNSLDGKKMIKHQSSKVGADGYLRTPLNKNFVISLLTQVLEENVPELPPEAQASSKPARKRSFESVGDSFGGEMDDNAKEIMQKHGLFDEGKNQASENQKMDQLFSQVFNNEQNSLNELSAPIEDSSLSLDGGLELSSGPEIGMDQSSLELSSDNSENNDLSIPESSDGLDLSVGSNDLDLGGEELALGSDDLSLDAAPVDDLNLGDTNIESNDELSLTEELASADLSANDRKIIEKVISNFQLDQKFDFEKNQDHQVIAQLFKQVFENQMTNKKKVSGEKVMASDDDIKLDGDLDLGGDIELGSGDDVNLSASDDSSGSELDLGGDDLGGIELGGGDDSSVQLESDTSDGGLDLDMGSSDIELGGADDLAQTPDEGLDLSSDLDGGLDLGSEAGTEAASADEGLDLSAGGDLDSLGGEELDFSSGEEKVKLDETGRDNRPVVGASDDHVNDQLAEIEAMMGDGDDIKAATSDSTGDISLDGLDQEETPAKESSGLDLDMDDLGLGEELDFTAPETKPAAKAMPAPVKEDVGGLDLSDDDLGLDFSNAPTDEDLTAGDIETEELEATSVMTKEELAKAGVQEAPFSRPSKDKTSTHVRNQKAEIDAMMADDEPVQEYGKKSKDITNVNLKNPSISNADLKGHAEMVGFHGEELAKLAAIINNLREERKDLIGKIDDLELKKEQEKRENIAIKAELDERKIELNLFKKRFNKQVEEAEYRLQLAEEKKRIAEEKSKTVKVEMDKLQQKVRVDLKKIVAREKELENQLEMLKNDSEIQIRNRDQKILELKRKIDSLEFDLDNIAQQEKSSKEENMEVEEKMEQVMKTLRSAITILEGDEKEFQSFEFLKKKNMDI